MVFQYYLNASTSTAQYWTILNPSTTTYTADVSWNFEECSNTTMVQVAATFGTACPNQCTGPLQGKCLDSEAKCECVRPYSGLDCSKFVDQLSAGFVLLVVFCFFAITC